MSQLERQRRKEEVGRQRRTRVVGFVLGALVVAGIAGLVLFFVQRPAVIEVPDVPRQSDLDPAVVEQIKTLRARAAAAPRDGAAWREMGLGFETNALYEPARIALEQAVLLAPDDPKAWFHLARVRLKQMETDAALQAFARARDLEPTYAASSWRRGFIMLEADDLDGAEPEFEAALRADPANVPATAGLARVALNRNDGARAEALLRPLVQARPRDQSLRFLLGSALRLQGKMEEAEVELEAGSSTMTTWHDPWELEALVYQVSTFGQVNQALAASADGYHDHAIRLLEKLRIREPDTASVVVNLAAEYATVGRNADAVSALGPFLAKEPSHPMGNAVFAQAMFGLNQFEATLEHVRLARESDPNLPRLDEFEAAALARLGRHAEAVAAFKRATHAMPNDANVAFGLGAAHMQLGEAELASVTLNHAVRLDPKHGRAWLALALAELKLERLDLAEAAFRKASINGALTPEDLGTALAQLKERRRAKGGG